MKNFACFIAPVASVLALAACSDDSGTGGTGGSTSTTTTTAGPGSSSANGATTSTSATTVTGSSTAETSASTGVMFDCEALSDTPTMTEIGDGPFSGSEDFTFDGKGNMVGKKGGAVVQVDAAGTETSFAPLQQPAFGLRFLAGGSLVVALPNDGKIVEVTKDQGAHDYVTGLQGPNGIFPDAAGNVWATEFQGGRVIKIDANKMPTTVTTANAPNGILFDATRNLVWFTEYSTGKIFRMDPDGQNKDDVETIFGAAPDGLAMDACGNLYVVDNGNGELYRVRLDADGNNTAMTERIATFNEGVANASFGQGPGFDPLSLYVAGNPGRVFRVEIGAPGASVVLPQ